MFGLSGKKKQLSDDTASKILTDLVDYKLVLAKYYLQKIDSSVPLNYDWKHFILEANCESFLFFSNLFKDLIQFTEEIRAVVPYKYTSSQYKHQINFDL